MGHICALDVVAGGAPPHYPLCTAACACERIGVSVCTWPESGGHPRVWLLWINLGIVIGLFLASLLIIAKEEDERSAKEAKDKHLNIQRRDAHGKG
jgi:hypothetical protein